MNLFYLDHTTTITQYQPVLYRIALNIVGSVRDAEDLVQDTFLRWLSVGPAKIKNTEAYLIRSVYNNSINFLQRFRKSETLSEQEVASPAEEEDSRPEIGKVIHAIDTHLKPVERAMLLLRESFNFDYEQLQELFGQKQEYCRQLVSRARRKIEEIDLSKTFSIDTKSSKTQSLFENASRFGHISELTDHFLEEIGKYLKK